MSHIKLKHLIEEGWRNKLGALGLAGSLLTSPASASPTTGAQHTHNKPAIKKQITKAVPNKSGKPPIGKSKQNVATKKVSNKTSGNPLAGKPKHGLGTKGIRNNNPGNIKKTTIPWKGVVGTDEEFLKFATPEDGIRAISRILKVYVTKYNLNTPSQIMSRWAPPIENPTKNYIGFVADKLGKKPNDKIDITNENEFSKLISAIISFECGSMPYDNDTIKRGIKKA